jgi:hypothetical protein
MFELVSKLWHHVIGFTYIIIEITSIYRKGYPTHFFSGHFFGFFLLFFLNYHIVVLGVPSDIYKILAIYHSAQVLCGT